MQKAKLGRSDLEIAPLMFGGNVFGATVDQALTDILLDMFVDAGLNAIDTADIYAAYIPGNVGGESERQIGAWLAQGGGRREKVMLATKCGVWDAMPGLSRKNILAACEGSLKRLQTDRIDLYFAHIDDPKTPLDETLEAFDTLVKAGKVRAIGASNYSAARLAAAIGVSAEKNIARFDVLQPHYNLMQRDQFEGEVQNLCLQEEISVVPHSALAKGFLTGKYRKADDGETWRAGQARNYLTPKGLGVLAALDAIRARTGETLAQISIAWLMTRKTVAAPIASATSVEQMRELLGAVNVKLDANDLAELERASA